MKHVKTRPAGRKTPPSGTCCQTVHEDQVLRVREDLPPEEILYDLADFFKALGDMTRVKILESLRRGELCVCDLAAILGASASAVSHQLKILRLSNFVKVRKAGKSAYYRLSDSHVSDILERGLDHVQEDL
ncbi:MAG: metalloregulator ArsR/SmtB family transcription factor [Spirochaetales bacterium]|jgi:ArsR family transcriptional regulator|nr:metalloregulator ArsR/SmtB family transcription factor [Spirochaetales bacterium]